MTNERGAGRCQGSSPGSRCLMLVIVTKSVIAPGSACQFNEAAWNSCSETPDPCLCSAGSGTGAAGEVNPTWHSHLELLWGFSLLPKAEFGDMGQSSLLESSSQNPRIAGVGRERCRSASPLPSHGRVTWSW